MTEKIPAWINGKLQPVDKLEVHKKGFQHKAISVLVLNKNQEILLQKRSMNKYHTPGLWTNTCCSHPKWNENSKVCANRRLFEELGISKLNLEFKEVIKYRANVGNNLIENEVVDIYTTNISDKKNLKININPLEVMEIKWLNIKETLEEINTFPQLFTPWFVIYLTQYADRILFK